MLTYLARRLFYAILTFFGITVAVFALIHLVPGDPISLYLGKVGMGTISQAGLAAVRHEYHLDQPLVAQYFWWLHGLLTLDLGRSIVDHRDVIERIREKLPNTFELNFVAFIVSALIGLPIGVWSAVRSGRGTERASAVVLFLLYSLPSFWVALLLVPVFAVRHELLPVIPLSYAQIAIFARFSKAALVEVIRQDFVTTARAKGAPPATVLWRHAFRNALLPLITLLGLTIPYLISGSVIVEQIFQW